MKITIFGATGALGNELTVQALEAGHTVTVLIRSASKCDTQWRDKAEVVEGDVLDAAAVASVISADTEAVFSAIGVVKDSPENLCADSTALILDAMKQCGVPRLIWCGGGSSLLPEDDVTMGAKFVQFFSATFMAKKHRDKENQLALLAQESAIQWSGIRPLQMKTGPRTGEYRLGYYRFSGMSSISFADCAHAMLGMLDGEPWIHKAPIVQY